MKTSGTVVSFLRIKHRMDLMKRYKVSIAAFSTVILAGPTGKWLAGQAVYADCLLYILPAVCGAASVYLLQKLNLKQRILPVTAGLLLTLLYHPEVDEASFWQTLFPPFAAAGVIIFLTGVFLLLDYIRTTLQKFKNIAAGKIPDSDFYEEK